MAFYQASTNAARGVLWTLPDEPLQTGAHLETALPNAGGYELCGLQGRETNSGRQLARSRDELYQQHTCSGSPGRDLLAGVEAGPAPFKPESEAPLPSSCPWPLSTRPSTRPSPAHKGSNDYIYFWASLREQLRGKAEE